MRLEVPRRQARAAGLVATARGHGTYVPGLQVRERCWSVGRGERERMRRHALSHRFRLRLRLSVAC
jgi:hypothetical protein